MAGLRATRSSARPDYRLSAHLPGGRGVYTFCMCPRRRGGGCASEEGRVVTNGNEPLCARRPERQFRPAGRCRGRKDFGSDRAAGRHGNGSTASRRLAFRAGGGGYRAPAQRGGGFSARLSVHAFWGRAAHLPAGRDACFARRGSGRAS